MQKAEFQWDKIKESKTMKDAMGWAQKGLATGWLYLSDVLRHIDSGGRVVLNLLDHESRNPAIDRRTVKLRAVCNQWGEAYSPGDEIEIVTQKHNREAFGDIKGVGDKLKSGEIKAMVRRGEGGRLKSTYTIKLDQDLCCDVPYIVAKQLLLQYGQSVDGLGICDRERIDILTYPRDIDPATHKPVTRKLHNWRWEEITPEYYEQIKKDRRAAEKAAKAEATGKAQA
jgi:hypothetical protein